jgi:hypothetical protein
MLAESGERYICAAQAQLGAGCPIPVDPQPIHFDVMRHGGCKRHHRLRLPRDNFVEPMGHDIGVRLGPGQNQMAKNISDVALYRA